MTGMRLVMPAMASIMTGISHIIATSFNSQNLNEAFTLIMNRSLYKGAFRVQ